MLYPSENGLVRISYQNLSGLKFCHYYSDLHDTDETELELNDSLTVLAGSTEWISKTTPLLSIGWCWKLDHTNNSIAYIMDGEPYSNIMIIDNVSHRDIGQIKTSEVLEKFISQLNWSDEVKCFINEKYS